LLNARTAKKLNRLAQWSLIQYSGVMFTLATAFVADVHDGIGILFD